MASKPSFPTALLRTCTTILGRRTSQLQLHASRLLNVELQSQSQSAWTRRFEDVTRGIERMGGSARLQPIPIRVQSQPSFGQRRWHSTDSSKVKQLEFEDVCLLPIPISAPSIMLTTQVLAILETPSDSRLLIDVREPDEFEANTIPTAINLPIFSQPEALLLDEEDFQDRFGFAKPPRNKEVIFFCKAGVRCSTAAKFARQAGCVPLIPVHLPMC
jgi:rhodanese-related sulfurtransferase